MHYTTASTLLRDLHTVSNCILHNVHGANSCRGCPADVYALGACLYTFVFGRIPFSAATVMKLFEVVQSTPVTFPEGIAASESLKELLLAMLAKVG